MAWLRMQQFESDPEDDTTQLLSSPPGGQQLQELCPDTEQCPLSDDDLHTDTLPWGEAPAAAPDAGVQVLADRDPIDPAPVDDAAEESLWSGPDVPAAAAPCTPGAAAPATDSDPSNKKRASRGTAGTFAGRRLLSHLWVQRADG